jgi:hypothetical protein
LRLDSCREQATKKTPDEELAKKVHWEDSSFARFATSAASKAAVNELLWLKPIVNPISVTEASGSWG